MSKKENTSNRSRSRKKEEGVKQKERVIKREKKRLKKKETRPKSSHRLKIKKIRFAYLIKSIYYFNKRQIIIWFLLIWDYSFKKSKNNRVYNLSS